MLTYTNQTERLYMKLPNLKFLPYLLVLPFSIMLFRAACWSLDRDYDKARVYESGQIGKMMIISKGYSENTASWFPFDRDSEYSFDLQNNNTEGWMVVSKEFYFEHEEDDFLQAKFIPGINVMLQPNEKKGNLYLKGSLLMILSILPFWIIREIQTRR